MSFGTTAADYQVPHSNGDGVQDIAWSPTADIMVGCYWDNTVRCWQVQTQGNRISAEAKAQISHDGPVLCAAFSGDGNTVFSGSCDKTAKMWQLGGSNQGQQIAAHDAPIKGIAAIKEMNCVVTGSWDKTVKYWDTRTPTPQATINLPERCYGLDVKYPLMVVATANRDIVVVDLTKPGTIFKTIQSVVKNQTRCIEAFPDKTGFAVGAIEGRVGIHYFDEKPEQKTFAFKCHRDGPKVYPVNSISFHPKGYFSTAGADGGFCFWNKETKQRLKQFPKVNQPIPVGKFNCTGSLFAYGVSYDWHKGAEGYNASSQSDIRIHYVDESELKAKKR